MKNGQSIKRSKLRLFLGRGFYLMKKKLDWWLRRNQFARKRSSALLPDIVFTHKTLLRRPLKDVDMQLQENKITNLQIAIKQIDGLMLEPGKTFSYWRSIGNPTKRKGCIEGMILKDGSVGTGVVVELLDDVELLAIAFGDFQPSVESHGTRWLVDLFAQGNGHQFVDLLLGLLKVALQSVEVDVVGSDTDFFELHRTRKRQKCGHRASSLAGV